MSLRRFTLVLACSALTALAATPALALTDPAAVAKGYKAPRDAWGHPDLSGVWSPATITRLERDPALGERLVLSEAEARAAEGDTAANNAKAALPTDQKLKVDDVDCGVKGFSGVACGYNAFWTDPGTRLIRIGGEARTSILTSPANGRLPARTAAAGPHRPRPQTGGNFDNPENRALGERCIVGFGGTSGPPMLPVLYNNHYEIQQTKDAVVIVVEMVHDARIIRLSGGHEPR